MAYIQVLSPSHGSNDINDNIVSANKTWSSQKISSQLQSIVNQGSGTAGADGREVELQKSATHIQWRYTGDSAWNNLIALSDLQGSDGANGLSAFQIAQEFGGFAGTEEQWLQSLVGQGVVAGGNAGQFLVKKSNDDFDTEWRDVDLSGKANIEHTHDDYITLEQLKENNEIITFNFTVNYRTNTIATQELNNEEIVALVNEGKTVIALESGQQPYHHQGWLIFSNIYGGISEVDFDSGIYKYENPIAIGGSAIPNTIVVGGANYEYTTNTLKTINNQNIIGSGNIDIPVVDLSDYYNKEDIDTQLQSKVDDVELTNNVLKFKANNVVKKEINLPSASGTGSVDLSNYYNKTEIDGMVVSIDDTTASTDKVYSSQKIDDLLSELPASGGSSASESEYELLHTIEISQETEFITQNISNKTEIFVAYEGLYANQGDCAIAVAINGNGTGGAQNCISEGTFINTSAYPSTGCIHIKKMPIGFLCQLAGRNSVGNSGGGSVAPSSHYFNKSMSNNLDYINKINISLNGYSTKKMLSGIFKIYGR